MQLNLDSRDGLFSIFLFARIGEIAEYANTLFPLLKKSIDFGYEITSH